MRESPINDSQPTPQAPAAVDAAAARQLASARRRRFIKLGGAAVPTALTLASRPVMAWHCNTASTWGSAQGMSNSSYTRSQDAARLFPDETYTLNNWLNNTKRSTLAANPWQQAPLNRNVMSTGDAAYFKFMTVGQLLSGTGATSIAGINNGDTVWSILNGSAKKPRAPFNGTYVTGSSSCGEFQKLMLVAWLNYRVLNATLSKCLKPGTTNVLISFGNNTYVGPKGAWGQTDVVKYLKKNWIACTDESCL